MWEIRRCPLILILIRSGLGPFNFAATNFQNLLNQAGFDPALSTPGNPQPCGTGDCFLIFAGKPQSINAIMLNTSGISCAIQTVLLITLGSSADYGKWRPMILIVWTMISWGAGFGWMAVHDASRWQAGLALYILGGERLRKRFIIV